MSRSRLVQVVRTGAISYANGLQLQKQLSSQNPEEIDKFNNFLILTEHHPVFTIGIRTKNYTEEDEAKLKSLGAEFYKTNRGGLITFHGPGQLVAYPILHLKHFTPSMRWYVSTLEKTIIETCRKFNLNAQTTADTGIWIGDNKICAIGIHGSRYITTHGIGLNCTTDLSWFKHIVPCGIEGKGVTSLSEQLSRSVTIDEAIPKLLESFSEHFDCMLTELDNKETLSL